MPPLRLPRYRVNPSKPWKFYFLYQALGLVGILLVLVVEAVIGIDPVLGGIVLAVTLIVVTLLMWRATRKYRAQKDT